MNNTGITDLILESFTEPLSEALTTLLLIVVGGMTAGHGPKQGTPYDTEIDR